MGRGIERLPQNFVAERVVALAGAAIRRAVVGERDPWLALETRGALAATDGLERGRFHGVASTSSSSEGATIIPDEPRRRASNIEIS